MEPPKAVVSETPEMKLYDAATRGDVATFQILARQNPFIVDQVSFARSRNLLHIATMAGHVGIVEELLRINSELARDVDSKKSSSLHIAAEQGHVEIVDKLFPIAPEMCWWLDDQGMNPVHIAAMKGHVEILKVLLENDSSPAMERLHRGQTVLHLCVKHRQLEPLKFLAEKLGILVAVKDDDGEKAIDLAYRCKAKEMIEYLTEKDTTETPIYLINMTGMTMVVVVLIAAMAFQAAVSPPGGVWQEDTTSHRAGKAVMAYAHPKLYKLFSRANTTAFVSSFLILLVAPLAATNSFLAVVTTRAATVVSMASIGVSYGASLIMTNPIETQTPGKVVAIVVFGFLGVYAFINVHMWLPWFYFTWKRVKHEHEDLTVAHRIRRYCYQLLRELKRIVLNFERDVNTVRI
ncbi:ankyrin repeat-containing protein NPR4-like [Salvia hispanica]|uniref:ankyrin repeat-containing protein NPR4-like n=1 Tax=Salvia hispanica TaxID=49212 RepID=UPI0020095534|nr:ankyrin repeat-containing protein NPR4-like [Salvia hispanica]